jgi:hypothetical protein
VAPELTILCWVPFEGRIPEVGVKWGENPHLTPKIGGKGNPDWGLATPITPLASCTNTKQIHNNNYIDPTTASSS